ncbi:MAG: FecR domain-containing protein [Bacteroidales bacterium]|nr:FecR domain-containing protein [Bacteroidales bacterium]
MSEENQHIWDAISSVLNDNATSHEIQLVEDWMKESEGNRKLYATIANIGFFRSMGDLQEIKERVRQKLENKIATKTLTRRVRMFQVLSAASVALLILMGSWMIVRKSIVEPVAIVETTIANGCKTTITLSDGTVVALNSGSTIQYPSHFNSNSREVKLVGEAYFEVAKDAKHPFVVHAQDMHVRVLGTHFNVKAYPEEDKITTTLLEGSVRVTKGRATSNLNSQLLVPNEQLIYNKTNSRMEIRKVDANLYASWKDNQYYFENERFSTIAKELERGYNMKIIINTASLRNETFSGTFEKKESFYRILDIMKKQRGFEYQIHEDTISIFDN